MTETQKKMRNNIIMMLMTVAAIYVVSYGWFFSSEQADVDDLLVGTRPANEVEISLDGGITWENQGALAISENYGFNNEITGDGIDFYVPDAKDSYGMPTSFKTASLGSDYLEFEVLFRTLIDSNIFLDTESYVIPAVGVNEEDLLGSEVTRRSSFGDFSKDLIAGAVRVAFVEGNYENDECIPGDSVNLVWAPNPQYELIEDNGNYSVDINSTNEQNYNFLDVVEPNVFSEERVTNLKDNINAAYATGFAYGDPKIATITGDLELESADISCIHVRVWVEGNDREAKSPLEGGLFRIKLYFVGIGKEDNLDTPNVSTNSELMIIDGFTEEMEYSLNYGNTWLEENSGFSVGDEVWVRYKERVDEFASNVIVINF